MIAKFMGELKPKISDIYHMELLPYKSIDPSFALHWRVKIIF